MKGKAKYAVALLLVGVGLGVFYACAPQRALAHRLKGADRVVVTNTLEGLSISVTGAEVNKIVRAITTGTKVSPDVEAAVGLTLEFYNGTEHLANVITGYEVFSIDRRRYRDTTGMLKALYERFREEHPPKISP
jgi:hypothetical protein